MKLDLLYELSCPKPWNEEKERNAYYNALEQIVLADQLGFGTVWEVEHHFLSEFSHSSAPEIFLACVSQRTERIRIGHGVVLLPNPFNYPIRVAERIAALDIMSRGRVEFGTGRSTWYEQAGFNVRPDETRAMWQEALSIIPKMWASEQFSHKGEHFEIPERNVLPKPIQRPHPPVWVAGTQDESFEIAGRLGIGMLALTIMVPVEELERRIAMYRKASENVEPITDVVNDRINCLTLVHCARTTREAIENGAPQAVAWYLRTVAALFAPPEGGEIVSGFDFAAHGRRSLEDSVPQLQNEATRAIDEFHQGEIGVDDLYEALNTDEMVIIGDPEQCRKKLERYADLGLNSLMCQVQIGDLPHEAVMESVGLLGREVRPLIDPD